MELKDLHLGDVVRIKVQTARVLGQGYLLSKEGTGTIIGFDPPDDQIPVLVGWKDREGSMSSEILGQPRNGNYVPDISDWRYRLWLSPRDIIAVSSIQLQIGTKCSKCGYENPYVSSPYVCSGCKLWDQVAG